MYTSHVERWHKSFTEGRTNVEDDERKGRPSDSIDGTVRCVRVLLDDDRRLTVTDEFLHEASRGSISTALTEHRWNNPRVPRQLPEQDHNLRMAWALELLTQYQEYGNELIERIVTENESWIHFWAPET